MSALLVSTDLMAISKINGAASFAGMTIPSASPAKTLEMTADAELRLVMIDLTAPIADIGLLVTTLRTVAPDAQVIAFGPHVHETKLAAAEAAGCDRVMPRGAFHKQIDKLLAGLKNA